MKFVFATNNSHKLEEARNIIKSHEVMSLKDLNIDVEIPEDHETLAENSLQKAQFIYEITNMNVFADDTGLEIEALDGRPGVYSARYAGEGCNFADNVKKVIEELKGQSNRRAAFRTVLVMIMDGKEYMFEGRVDGHIIEESVGRKGFGYDPIFVPEGYNQTFAQMTAELKNSMSHRARAFHKVVEFLELR